MIKIIGTFFLIWVVAHCNLFGQVSNDLELYGYKGSVKSVLSISTAYKTWEVYTFDRNGNLLTYTEYNADSTIKNRITCNYDEKGHLISHVQDSESKIYYHYYEYVYFYDRRGNQTRIILYNGKKEISRNWKNKFDSKGNCIKTVEGWDLNELDSRYFRKFDEHGNEIEEKQCNSNGSLHITRYHKYNSFNKVTEESSYDSKGIMLHKRVYEFDERGLRISESYFDKGDSLMYRNTFVRNQEGDVIKEIGYDRNMTIKNTYNITYKYDLVGNWIESCVTSEKINSCTTRIFEYYE